MTSPPSTLHRTLKVLWKRRGIHTASAQWTLLKGRLTLFAGAVALGVMALAFAASSDRAQRLFLAMQARWPMAALAVCPVIFAGAVLVTQKFAPAARGSGIPQVIAVTKIKDRALAAALVSPATASAKFGLTIVMLLAGASVGREGPTVQIGAAIMVLSHRILRVPLSAGIYIAGGAAGVAAAFNTPLAGVAFAIEELAAAYEQKVALTVMVTVMFAGLVSLGIAGDYVYFGAMDQSLSMHSMLLVAPAIGILGGLAGGLFSRMVLGFTFSQNSVLCAMRNRPVTFAALCGLVIALLGIVSHGATWGTGYGVTRQMVEGQGQPLWFGPAKFAATLMTTLAGAPGGIFAPSLSVGAGIGNLLSPLFAQTPTGAIAVLGMAAYLVGVVRAPITGVIIVSETTTSHELLLPLFAAALIADAVSALICRERLYHGLAKSFLHQPGSVPKNGNTIDA